VSGLLLTLTAARLQVATVEVGALPPASPPADMSSGALPTGTYETPAIFAFRGGSWNDTRHFASTAVLVHHPKGNLLIPLVGDDFAALITPRSRRLAPAHACSIPLSNRALTGPAWWAHLVGAPRYDLATDRR